MSDQFLGEIRIFGCPYAPRGWALCNGQNMPIAQNAALYSLLGTYYGGDGRTTFALPNLQGRVPMFFGQGQNLSNYYQGQTGGATTVTLSTDQMPSHTHALQASTGPATSDQPAGLELAAGHSGTTRPLAPLEAYVSGTAPTTQMNPNALGNIGSGQAHNNMMPYVVHTFCIALQGIYPPRP